MPNFFIKKVHIEDDKIRISGELLRHLRDSLRIKTGERFFCVDEDGTLYTVVAASAGKGLLIADIVEKNIMDRSRTSYINLVQSVPRGPKMEFIIQKATELGVNAITPVISERSVVRLEKGRAEDKLERWRRIALEAAQQSGRRDVPEITPLQSLKDFLSSYGTAAGAEKPGLSLLLWEGEKKSGIKGLLKGFDKARGVTLLIGPEGGFSDAEVDSAISAGFIPASLGGLVLRTETAPLAAISVLRYEFGDMD